MHRGNRGRNVNCLYFEANFLKFICALYFVNLNIKFLHKLSKFQSYAKMTESQVKEKKFYGICHNMKLQLELA